MEVGLRRMFRNLGTEVVDVLRFGHAAKSGGRHWFERFDFDTTATCFLVMNVRHTS